MIRFNLTILITFLGCSNVFSQDDKSLYSDDRELKISVSVGPTWQSTMMNFFDLKPIYGTQQFCIPFNYERNIQGVGFSPSISIFSKSARIGVDYTLNLRYDYIYHIFGMNKEVNEVITNNYFGIYKILNRRNNKSINHILGFGYGIINTKKSFVFDNTCIGNSNDRLNLQFSVLEIHYRIPIKKVIFIEPKMNITTNGHPINRNSQYAFYDLRLGCTF